MSGFAAKQARGVDARQQTRGDVAHVTFDARDLTREEKVIAGDVLQGGTQKFGRGDKGVAVHLTEALELGILQPGDHAQDAFLFGEFEIGLKADEVVKTAREIILTKLNNGIRTPACARVAQADGAHGTEGKRINSALGDDSRRADSLQRIDPLSRPSEWLLQMNAVRCARRFAGQ